MIRCIAVLLAAAGSCAVLAQDTAKTKTSSDTARAYVTFWKPFVGTWDFQIDGDPPASFVWHGEETPSGLYYMSAAASGGPVLAVYWGRGVFGGWRLKFRN